MTPVDQTEFFDPDRGLHGNCHQAAVASILDLPLEAVPHFARGTATPGEFTERYWAFMRARGFWVCERFFFRPEATPGPMPVFHLASGPSPRGVDHTVVYRDGVMVHDPHPSRDGIVRVLSIDLFVPLDPAKMVLAS